MSNLIEAIQSHKFLMSAEISHDRLIGMFDSDIWGPIKFSHMWTEAPVGDRSYYFGLVTPEVADLIPSTLLVTPYGTSTLTLRMNDEGTYTACTNSYDGLPSGVTGVLFTNFMPTLIESYTYSDIFDYFPETLDILQPNPTFNVRDAYGEWSNGDPSGELENFYQRSHIFRRKLVASCD